MRWKKPLLFTILAGVAITVVAIMYDGFFGGISVCSECGRTKHYSRTYWIERTRIEETALSRFHDELAEGREHEHHWLLAHGSGGLITCAIGKGRHLMSAVNREETKQALELIRKHRGDETASQWLDRLLDPDHSRDAMNTLMTLTHGERDFEADYKEMLWLQEMKEPSTTLK